MTYLSFIAVMMLTRLNIYTYDYYKFLPLNHASHPDTTQLVHPLFPVIIVDPSGRVSGKEPICQCKRHKRHSSIPASGRFPGGGHGNPLQYSCLENPHGQRRMVGYSARVTKSRTRLMWLSTQCTLLPLLFSLFLSIPEFA